MDFPWRQFVAVARGLASESGEEYYRSAVSRAYYAAYGVAWDRLSRSDQDSIRNKRGVSKHEAVWQLYDRDYNADNDSIGEMGADLKAERQIADYVASRRVSAGAAELAIKRHRS